ncbi:hypothetical protein [Kineosporia sp. A_224]|uniref:hypothetical protein n=1 Tax=Kineosporia sp. A_224 TaxID=1962180 RepID=UPI000B4BBBBC|nr:hypothetical protein [Kineosporia sp. A_224]
MAEPAVGRSASPFAADAWNGPGGSFGPPVPTVAGQASGSGAGAAGGGFLVDPQQVETLAGRIGELPVHALRTRQELVRTMDGMPATVFGLVAASNDAFMAYRRRVGAANTELEAADLELQELSETLGETVKSYRWADTEAAQEYSRVNKAFSRTTGGASAPAPGH